MQTRPHIFATTSVKCEITADLWHLAKTLQDSKCDIFDHLFNMQKAVRWQNHNVTESSHHQSSLFCQHEKVQMHKSQGTSTCLVSYMKNMGVVFIVHKIAWDDQTKMKKKRYWIKQLHFLGMNEK